MDSVLDKALKLQLQNIKAALVEGAIEASLDSDFNNLDMANLAARGAEITGKQIKGLEVKFAIHLEDNQIKGVFSNDVENISCKFYVFDYDTDGVDEDEISLITQPDDDKAEAYVRYQELSNIPGIDINEVFDGWSGD